MDILKSWWMLGGAARLRWFSVDSALNLNGDMTGDERSFRTCLAP
jgi:hypothetical protein